MTTITEPQTQPAREAAAAPARQFVNFMFFKTDRAWRRETAEVKSEAKREFAEIIRRHTGPMMVLPYSTVGLKQHRLHVLAHRLRHRSVPADGGRHQQIDPRPLSR